MLIERMQHYTFPGTLASGTASLNVAEPVFETFLFKLTAVAAGAAGNAISFEVIVAGNNTAFNLNIVGSVITVTASTDGGGISMTLGDLITALQADPAFNALVTISNPGVAGLFFGSFPATNLFGGFGTGTSSPTQGLQLRLDQDAPFRLFGVMVWNLGVSQDQGFDGQVSLRFTHADGRYVQRNLTSSNLLFPGNQYSNGGQFPNKGWMAPIHPNILYPPNSTITVDIEGLPTGATAPPGFVIVFIGTKLFEQGAIWAPQYPAKWRGLSYLENLTVPSIDVTTGVPLLNQLFTAQQDADFVWQAGAYTDFPVGANTPLCQLQDLGVIVRDFTNKPYSNNYIPVGLLFPFMGCENPGFLYPEIYVPKRQQLLFDFNYLYAGFTPAVNPVQVVLGLKGMKVYPL